MTDATKSAPSLTAVLRGMVAAGFAVAAIFLALTQTLTMEAPYPFVLLSAILVAAIAGRYEFLLPRTKVRLKPSDLITFWAVISIGLQGGILVGLVGALAGSIELKPLRTRLFAVADEVICVSIGTLAYILVLSVIGLTFPSPSVSYFILPLDIVAASLVLATVVATCRSRVSFPRNYTYTGEGFFTDRFIAGLAASCFNIVATILMVYVFRHFGLEFGFVVLPLVVIAHLAYVFHKRTLDNKTSQILQASRLHLSTVEALATAIDARDQVGMGHVRRTQIFAVGLGRALGLSAQELDALRMGALLHDVGKLAVPDHILNKPGRLTPAELEKTKIHASVGASILESIDFPYPVVPTVRHHHERWDGGGYPNGLIGTQIPLTARILTIADIYDTLRGARPYREAINEAEVLEHLRSNSGKRFDPRIVAAFIKILPELEEEVRSLGLGYERGNDTGSFVLGASEFEGGQNFVQQIKRANREVFTLYSLAKEFGATADLDDSLRLFTEKIGEIVPYDTCIVYLLNKSGEMATARHVVGSNRDDILGSTVAPGEGATGYVLRSRQPVQNVDPALDFAFTEWEFSRDFIGMASIPLVAKDEMVGAVSLYTRKLACYSDEHVRILETIARIATDSILRSQQLEEAETFALTDPMTGLPNSRGLQSQFEKEAKRADRNGSGFQLLVLDLDGFKAINDTHGHKVGDTMLRGIANVIHEQLREYDFLARYGGDEFVAIVPGTETIDILELCRRIERAVGEYEMVIDENTSTNVGISIGSASFPTQGETFDQLIVAADKAMYMTKAIHRQEREIERRSQFADPPRPSVLREDSGRKNEPIVEPVSFIDEPSTTEVSDPEMMASQAIN